MVKIVFLSMPVPGGFFPLGKRSFLIFFTVKHFFFKIKSWPGRTGRQREKKEGCEHEKA